MKTKIVKYVTLDSTKTNMQVEKDDLRSCGHYKDGVEDENGVKRLRVICSLDDYFFTKLTLRSILTLWDAEIAYEDEEEVCRGIRSSRSALMNCHFVTTLSWDTYMQYFRL